MALTVAVLGTGLMGSGMARSLLRDGHDVRVWNRTRDKAEPLADDGATVVDSAAAAVEDADAVLTMLFDTDAVASTMADALPSFGERTVWVQTSTVGIDGTDRLAAQARDAGVAFLDTPVVGTKDPAEQGALVVLPSGDRDLEERVRPVFDAIGSRTIWAGDEVGAGSQLKLVVNAWLATVVGGVAQSVALAGDLGLDPRLFLDTISGQALDSAYAQLKGGAMVSGDFEPSFALDGVLKDTQLILDAAHSAGTHTGLLAMLADRLAAADRAGLGSQDTAAVVSAYRAGG
ncbi:NAD(P)-dependent oxidoreductase [Actinomycetospora sp. TBRC 11914]|uniref:NAD(P)-dependent oxidoreductase n=1 Tax=Actinomycetospora sp. TBRC 11914 TaxID=2729387 RepID=UPI00145CE77F|nr:NAD(P)-dependent oxidoreductase [Actinomycetospora sp. TBRC 11914]NMO90995.1 NAD(P)-dependent oxidoreductase [Actinomycetospora sp. TBRC 11914]